MKQSRPELREADSGLDRFSSTLKRFLTIRPRLLCVYVYVCMCLCMYVCIIAFAPQGATALAHATNKARGGMDCGTIFFLPTTARPLAIYVLSVS